MSEKTDDPKELQVFISEKTTNEKEKASRFSFFKKKKPKDETDLPGSNSPVLPLVKFDSEGDFFKEKLETDNENAEEAKIEQSPALGFFKKYISVDSNQMKSYFKSGFNFLFSQIGLLGLVIGYTVIGALVFMKTEGSYMKENQEKIEKNREDFYANVKHSAEIMFNAYLKANFHTKYNLYRIDEMKMKDDEIYHETLKSFKKNMLNSTNDHFLEKKADKTKRNVNTDNDNLRKIAWSIELDKEVFFKHIKDHLSTLLQENVGLEDKGDSPIAINDNLWNFPNAMLFAATIITTVGYGNITPKSNIGKIFTIFYALIGIPLFIMCLTNTGDLLAEILITCYSKTVKFIAKLLCKSKLKMPYSASKFQENKQEMLNEFEAEYDNPDDRHVPIPVSVGVLMGYIIAGACLFAVTEGWSMLDGVYFCFVTFSTIGFGDFVPGKSTLETGDSGTVALCSIYLLFGMIIMTSCMKLMQDEVGAKAKMVAQRIGIV